MTGGLLFALAGFVLLTSTLNFIGYREAQRSLVGIGILLAAAVMMPWLAGRKRKLTIVTSSAALKADAVESALCGYMAWIALALTPLILRDGKPYIHLDWDVSVLEELLLLWMASESNEWVNQICYPPV
jgi:divalent metal cation (Fe/Co/Zn/Cd) transporter